VVNQRTDRPPIHTYGAMLNANVNQSIQIVAGTFCLSRQTICLSRAFLLRVTSSRHRSLLFPRKNSEPLRSLYSNATANYRESSFFSEKHCAPMPRHRFRANVAPNFSEFMIKQPCVQATSALCVNEFCFRIYEYCEV